MRELIEYAAVRNIEIIPEIDLPGHSLCLATIHPEVLCDYTPDLSSSLGYDTRSALCATDESNYRLLEDILGEVCGLFPSKHIHVGGDEVDMAQWRRCPTCSAYIERCGGDAHALQSYFMSRIESILLSHGKHASVWNEAVDGGRLSAATHVYGWEGVKQCLKATADGYATVVMPGAYFYFDMKQSPRERGTTGLRYSTAARYTRSRRPHMALQRSSGEIFSDSRLRFSARHMLRAIPRRRLI